MHPLFVSYYTAGTPYGAEAAELIKTLDEHGLEHRVACRVSRGSWQADTQQKAEVVRDMIQINDGRPLVWLDADARVERIPLLFNRLDCDFAAHWLGGKELLSSTLYFGPTAAARRLALAWCERNRTNPHGRYGDQQNLQDVVEETPNLRVFDLPPEYAWIERKRGVDDISATHYGSRRPIIRQTQASRVNK